MDDHKKRELFEKYDFSKTGILKRAGVGPQSPVKDLYHDIAGMVQSLIFECERLESPEIREVREYDTIQNRIYRDFGWLQTQYLSIDWDELSADDPDFQVFFRMKEALNRLGRTLYFFLHETRKALDHGKDSLDDAPLRDLIERIGQLMRVFQETRERIEEKAEMK
ncbi:MAG: hypothetical protein K9N10_11310 [Deltaproteobacteria bacterium]|nr:hypothetical protein [Deltaproteobacteria bacterium]